MGGVAFRCGEVGRVVCAFAIGAVAFEAAIGVVAGTALGDEIGGAPAG